MVEWEIFDEDEGWVALGTFSWKGKPIDYTKTKMEYLFYEGEYSYCKSTYGKEIRFMRCKRT